MKIKLDENLPVGLAQELAKLGYDTHTVFDEHLVGASDSNLWEAAQAEERFFITQDLDFSDIKRFAPGSHFGILLVRLRDPGRLALTRLVTQLFMNEAVLSWEGCFVVVTERKLRIRRPDRPLDGRSDDPL